MRYSFIILSSVFLLSNSVGKSQNEDILHYFKLMPSIAFDGTSEGISKNEIFELAENKKTDLWNLEQQSYNKLTVTCFDQKVTMLLLEYYKDPMIVVQTNNAQSTILKTWIYDNSNQTFYLKDLFPEISINDFFDEKDAFANPEKYKSNIILYINESDLITADLYTWMQAEFENKRIKYDIFLKWEENRFKKIIKRKE